MKESVRSGFSKGISRVALVAVAICVAAASAVYAKPNAENATDKTASVVAHVPISSGPVTHMLLIKEAGKKYLLLGSESSSNVAIVDVSKPARARIVETSAGATGAASAQMKDISSALTMFRMLEAEKAISSSPEAVQGFSGVTSSITDKHGLIYLANGDGLWIVKRKPAAQTDVYTDPNANYYGGGD